MDVTIVVATFGDASWIDLAENRALPSARQFDVPVVHHHGDTLHDARNAAVAQVETEWVCHLDADDELVVGYFDAMAEGSADVRAPAVSYVRGHHGRVARVPRVFRHPEPCDAACLDDGNWLVVGSLVRADMVRQVGGWRDFEWSEDWDLWLRCRAAGATFEPIPDAVYRAHVRRDSRHRSLKGRARLEAHRAIAAANGLPA